MESNEIMDAALERTGDMQISLSLQETMRGAMKVSDTVQSDLRYYYSKIHNYWRVAIFFRTAGIERVSRPSRPCMPSFAWAG